MFEIGNSLREARMRQGLDYPQVELATKIRVKYIRALEEDQFAVLPAQTYVKGFLRTYADFLGLDGQLYVDEYNSRFVVNGVEDAPLRRIQPRAGTRRERGIERKVVLLALVGIAALTALVIAAWKFGGSSPSAAPPVPLTVPSELQLTGVGKGSYVEVRRGSATGVVLLQATVPGRKVERVAGSRFWLYVKAPASLRVRLAGKPVSLPARRNLKVVITPSLTALAGG